LPEGKSGLTISFSNFFFFFFPSLVGSWNHAGELAISEQAFTSLQLLGRVTVLERKLPQNAAGGDSTASAITRILTRYTMKDSQRSAQQKMKRPELLEAAGTQDSNYDRNQCAAPLAYYVSETAAHKILNGYESSIGELRQVCVLFLRLPKISFVSTSSYGQNKETLWVCQTALECVMGPLEKYEGTLRQMMQDDKGMCILCFFG
jgi:hypothetical protein